MYLLKDVCEIGENITDMFFFHVTAPTIMCVQFLFRDSQLLVILLWETLSLCCIC